MYVSESKHRNWNSLQGRARGSQTPAAYLLLLSALDSGWQIVEPVQIQTSPASNQPEAYHIRLSRGLEGELQHLVVHHCPEIENVVRSLSA